MSTLVPYENRDDFRKIPLEAKYGLGDDVREDRHPKRRDLHNEDCFISGNDPLGNKS